MQIDQSSKSYIGELNSSSNRIAPDNFSSFQESS